MFYKQQQVQLSQCMTKGAYEIVICNKKSLHIFYLFNYSLAS